MNLRSIIDNNDKQRRQTSSKKEIILNTVSTYELSKFKSLKSDKSK